MQNIISETRKFIIIDDLKTNGYSQYKINKLVDAGILKKITRKMYENLGYDGEDSDLYYAYAYAPEGIICLMSAAVYYDLTTFRPDVIDVAIHRKSKISTLPSWPALKIHYFTDSRYSKGINIINDSGNIIKIYDIEKTVCDIIFYRNIIGVEETKEILRNYLNLNIRNVNKLIKYAGELKCDDVLNTYLEVLL